MRCACRTSACCWFTVIATRRLVFARVLDPECTNFAVVPEIVLRDDGGNGDLGYPWATLLSKNRALVVYYFNVGDGTRHIAGTILEINR